MYVYKHIIIASHRQTATLRVSMSTYNMSIIHTNVQYKYIAFLAKTLHTHLLKGETNHLSYNLRDFPEVTSHSLLPKLATCNNITTSLWFHICHAAHNNTAKNGVYKSYSLTLLITPFTDAINYAFHCFDTGLYHVCTLEPSAHFSHNIKIHFLQIATY